MPQDPPLGRINISLIWQVSKRAQSGNWLDRIVQPFSEGPLDSRGWVSRTRKCSLWTASVSTDASAQHRDGVDSLVSLTYEMRGGNICFLEILAQRPMCLSFFIYKTGNVLTLTSDTSRQD